MAELLEEKFGIDVKENAIIRFSKYNFDIQSLCSNRKYRTLIYA